MRIYALGKADPETVTPAFLMLMRQLEKVAKDKGRVIPAPIVQPSQIIPGVVRKTH